MDERLRYEQLIEGKLQSLPVPDMQDAIWARVKAQLDIDMPTDEGDGGSSPQSPSGPKIIGWGLSVVIIALVTVFLLLNNKPKTKINSEQPTTTQQTISPTARDNSPPVQKDDTVNKTTAPVTGANKALDNAGNDSVMQHQPVSVVSPVDDSVRTNMSPVPITLSPPQLPDTASMVKKKGKGMTGLSDSSYRIVPKSKN